MLVLRVDTGEKGEIVRGVGVKSNHRCWCAWKIDVANVASHAR